MRMYQYVRDSTQVVTDILLRWWRDGQKGATQRTIWMRDDICGGTQIKHKFTATIAYFLYKDFV